MANEMTGSNPGLIQETSPTIVDRLRQFAGRTRQAALVGITAAGVFVGCVGGTETPPVQPEPAAAESYSLDRLKQLETTYGVSHGEASDAYATTIYDELRSDETTLFYQYEGLPELSFARPTLETVRKVLEADTIAGIEESVKPFFAARGMQLHMTDIKNHPANNGAFKLLTEENIEQTRTGILGAVNEMALTPIELTDFADISDVVVTGDIHWKNKDKEDMHAAGMAYMSDNPGTLAINVLGVGPYGNNDTWNHEMGHHVLHQVAKKDTLFVPAFANTNPNWFAYTPVDKQNKDDATIAAIRKRAVDEHIVTEEYSTEADSEDIANTYKSLYFDEMSPDKTDKSYGEPLGWKRVLTLEAIDKQVPGTKKYFAGLSDIAIYPNINLPHSLQDLELVISQGVR